MVTKPRTSAKRKENPNASVDHNSNTKKTIRSKTSIFRKRPLLVGSSDFEDIIEKEAAFVDKTLLIRELIDDSAKAVAILCPRLFGKSTNLSMLKSFFSLGASSSNFDRFLVGRDEDFVSKHCGEYPVVFINMKDCKGDSWEEMYQSIWYRIREMVRSHAADLTGVDLSSFALNKFVSKAPEDSTCVASSLEWLTKSLKKVHGKQVIVLIDEYNAPLNYAFEKKFHDRASTFFQSFYGSAIKDNPALKKACLMGKVGVHGAVAGAGILSGLNNLRVYSGAETTYSKYFGFDRAEMRLLLQEVGKARSLQDFAEWNNGDHSRTFICPWSFVNWLRHDKRTTNRH